MLKNGKVDGAVVRSERDRLLVCAWCPDFSFAEPGAGISHGICESCRERVFREIREGAD